MMSDTDVPRAVIRSVRQQWPFLDVAAELNNDCIVVEFSFAPRGRWVPCGRMFFCAIPINHEGEALAQLVEMGMRDTATRWFATDDADRQRMLAWVGDNEQRRAWLMNAVHWSEACSLFREIVEPFMDLPPPDQDGDVQARVQEFVRKTSGLLDGLQGEDVPACKGNRCDGFGGGIMTSGFVGLGSYWGGAQKPPG